MKLLGQASNNQVDLALKIFKSVFVRDFVEQGKRFSDRELSAALLIVAFHCLLKTNPQSVFGGRRGLGQGELSSLSNADCLSFCLQLYQMVSHCCPLQDAMPPPDLKSITSVRSVLTGQNWCALGENVSSIGFTYEILGLAARKLALFTTQTANKELAVEELVAFTQLYTPDWVVDFLTTNTILPFLDRAKVESIEARYDQWRLPQKTQEPKVRRKLRHLKLIDPACGSGQFLLAGFDLLYTSHLKDRINSTTALQTVLFDNLYGADIDDRAIWVTCLGLLVKSLLLNGTIKKTLKNLVYARPDSWQESDLMGSISRNWLKEKNHILSQTYDVVVTNPPYIGRKSLSRKLKLSLKEEYSRCGSDICAAFLERSMEMLSPGGRMGMITQSSLLTLPSYQDLRQYLLNRYHFDSVIQCGTGVFPRSNGEKIDSVLLIATAPIGNYEPVKSKQGHIDLRTNADFFVSLEKKQDKATELQKAISHFNLPDASMRTSSTSVGNSNSNFVEKVMQSIVNIPTLSSVAQVKQGLATTNNQRFVRSYWDIPEEDLGPIWVPYIKGAGSERWCSENNFVVKWGKDGSEIKQAVVEAYPYLKGKSGWVVKNEQFYFKPGLCFSFINKHKLAVRRLPAGSIFDVASSAIFSDNGDEDFLFAYLNSSLLSKIAHLINPTINMQVGDVKRLPVPPFSRTTKEKLGELARRCYDNKLVLQSLWSKKVISESDTDLSTSLTELRKNQINAQEELSAAEAEIDELVINSFAKLGCFGATDLTSLSRDVDVPPKREPDERAFASRVLVEACVRMMTSKRLEQTTILPLSSGAKLGESLGFDASITSSLESMLGMPLAKYLTKSSVCDLSRQAKTASRYLSVYLSESQAIMLLSARSIKANRPLTPNGIDERAMSEAEDILKRANVLLGDKADWTTNDLRAALER